MAAFGVDVLDPSVSTRRIGVLLDRLPPWARGGGSVWSTEAELLALIVDHLAALTWITMRAHGAKNVRKPRPVPRPDTRYANRVTTPAAGGAESARNPSEEAKAGSWAEAAEMLAGMPGMRTSGG
jgi:hypothetical protein